MQTALLFWCLCVLCPVGYSLVRLRAQFAWNQVDFTWPSPELRSQAIRSKLYVADNVLPLGLEAGQDRIVLTLPRWKEGLPATLATIPRPSDTESPLLSPYPNWIWHQPGNCDGLISVFRVKLDSCNRLWVLDSGAVDAGVNIKYICPPKLLVFDFATDNLLIKYELPKDMYKEGSLFINVVVDLVDDKCGLNAFAYLGDVWRFGLVVYNLSTNTSRRIEHEYFYPDPMAAKFNVNGLTFRWPDGIFGMALSPPTGFTGERTLFFHPMASFREFSVSTLVLRNSTATKDEIADLFHAMPARGRENEHSSGSAMSRNGILFYNLVTRNAVGCWNSRLPYLPDYQGIVDSDDEELVFPNDMRIDQDETLWVLSNKLPLFIYKGLDSTDINFRIFSARVMDAVRGGVCDPTINQNKVRPASRSLYNLRGIFETQFGCKFIDV